MRRKHSGMSQDFKILLLDDDQGIIDSLSVVLNKAGYYTEGITSPLQAISKLQNENFDMLILDFLMEPIHGDKVVEKIREFDKDIHIILLTGHKDLAPPLETINTLQIQGYCEKGDNFDQLLLLVESGRKSIAQVKTITKYQDGLNKIINSFSNVYEVQKVENILEQILLSVKDFSKTTNALIFIHNPITEKSIVRGIGQYDEGIKSLDKQLIEDMEKSKSNQCIIDLENGIIFPLVHKSNAIGTMYVECEKTEYNLKLLEVYISQISSYINYAILQSILKMRNNELVKSKEDLSKFNDVLRTLVGMRDSSMKGHLDRVSYYVVKLGETFDLNSNELEQLRVSGLLHDIFQNEDVDDLYLNTNKSHILKFEELLSPIYMFKNISEIIKYHHEKVDGSGTFGLTDNQIPLMSKIITVVDAFDVMMNTRHYALDDVKRKLIEGKGKNFASEVVDNFINLLEDYYLLEEEVAFTYEEIE